MMRDDAVEKKRPLYLLWLDLETTGLRPDSDRILEIGWSLTHFGYPYAPLSPGQAMTARMPVALLRRQHVVHCPAPRQYMDDVALAMHRESGLLAELEDQTLLKATLSQVEAELLALSEPWLGDKDERVPLAGYSVGFDKRFIEHWMSAFHRRLSHRVFDVSAMQLQAQSAGHLQFKTDHAKHRVMADIAHAQHKARELAAVLL